MKKRWNQFLQNRRAKKENESTNRRGLLWEDSEQKDLAKLKIRTLFLLAILQLEQLLLLLFVAYLDAQVVFVWKDIQNLPNTVAITPEHIAFLLCNFLLSIAIFCLYLHNTEYRTPIFKKPISNYGRAYIILLFASMALFMLLR
ncbi:hypothetical protein [Risungbinella massiliensis]|uniref:hypothetical protein n=1 Tax=Risungbinella massiliensis TaxID=1329796 RepID=UPI0005CBFB07|nr:hypothetical protein [Risungbinella massiliensis]